MIRVLVCVALLAWASTSWAIVYKWVDAQGKTQYGDSPPNNVHAEVVELLGTHAARTVPARDSTPTAPPKSPSGIEPSDADKKAVADDVAQTREKQCAEAQEHYKKLIEGRRIYKEGPNGERQYLTSEEIDAQRINAKQDVDTICNSAT